MQNLSASDLLSLDAGFHTAREEDADSGDQELQPRRGFEVRHGDARGQPAAENHVTSSSHSCLGGKHQDTREASGSESFSEEPPEVASGRLGQCRSAWREQSLMSKSQAKQLELLRQQVFADDDDDDDAVDPAALLATVRGGQIPGGANNGSVKGTTMPKSGGGCNDDGNNAVRTCENLLFDKFRSQLSLEAQACLCDEDDDEEGDSAGGPIQIKIHPAPPGLSAAAAELPRRDPSLGAAATRAPPPPLQQPRSKRLEAAKSFLCEINNILATPVAPPPSRATSEADLEQAATQEQQQQQQQQQRPAMAAMASAKPAVQVLEKPPFDSLTSTRSCNNLLQLEASSEPLASSASASLSATSEILLGVQHHETGSLSDNSYKLTKYCARPRGHSSERRQFEERFRNWKQSKKVITSIHENPLNMHMDCLNRLCELESTLSQEQRGQQAGQEEGDEQQEQQQQQQEDPTEERSNENGGAGGSQQRLSQCANHLTHMYKRNPENMDSSSDFRTLLYNIICCLLVQDEQVLATPSVGKMLEVIRVHLDSASKGYASASAQLVSSNLSLGEVNKQQLQTEQQPVVADESQAALSRASSTMSENNHADSAAVPNAPPTNVNKSDMSKHIKNSTDTLELVVDGLRPPDSVGRSKRCADFRRVSSVSYNDQQLINDLCPIDDYQAAAAAAAATATAAGPQRSGSLSGAPPGVGAGGGRRPHRDSWSPSPWAYQEISERPSGNCAHHSAGSNASQTQYTSQSSLEQMLSCTSGSGGGGGGAGGTKSNAANAANADQSDPMNDSGNGTMYEYQIASDFGAGRRRSQGADGLARLSQRASSICSESLLGGLVSHFEQRQEPRGRLFSAGRRLSDFRPQQQPSYMSTDDYLSSTNNSANVNANRTSYYDDDDDDRDSSTLRRYDCLSSSHSGGAENQDECEGGGGKSAAVVDVAARRAELEWTLNKLINIELKHTWLTSQDTLRRAIRKIGVPNEIRGKVWLILIEQMLGKKYEVARILERARQTVKEDDKRRVEWDEETQGILKQIELDVNRTMPGHRLFDDGAEGGVKLRLILVAYSIHVNRAIAYCQGFNFIVALLLSVFEGDEEKALSGFICIVDHIFPSKYYFDHYLTGARADQFLLADFICDQLIKNPTMAERKMVEGVTSSITLNWFISLFHGAVPTLTRLTILDHFMLEGVKALFRFTMAILYLAFQVTPPSSCEIFQTIRNTAKDMYDIKLLLTIVGQIKLPKDSYFAIRRSFYMVQSSFNSDQFYMQTLSSEAARSLVSSKPLSVQPALDTKPPALSLISSASLLAGGLGRINSSSNLKQLSACAPDNSSPLKQQQQLLQLQMQQQQQQQQQQQLQHPKPRICTSADRSKVCVQSLGKLGRSHLRIIDTQSSSNERSLMSPLRNCLMIGLSNCGKHLVLARQASRRNYRTFREQDLSFHVHELHTEIFDGFFLEEQMLAIILTHQGEVFKASNCCASQPSSSSSSAGDECETETLMLRESSSLAGHEKVKLRLCTMDCLTNLLWIYVECEDSAAISGGRSVDQNVAEAVGLRVEAEMQLARNKLIRNQNPFLAELFESAAAAQADEHCLAGAGNRPPQSHQRAGGQKASYSRKIIIVDIVTFDLFSAFAVHPNFGELTNLRASLVAFCQLLNPASNQFSTRIVQIGPTGRYEQLLSFSDVVDYMISVPDSYRRKYIERAAAAKSASAGSAAGNKAAASQRYSTLRRLLTHSMSFQQQQRQDESPASGEPDSCDSPNGGGGGGTLTRYYRSLMRSYSTAAELEPAGGGEGERAVLSSNEAPKLIQDAALRSIVAASFGDFSELSETNYIPVNMAFIFRNGKIALFEFTESYAIHTRESQLDRYDYSKVIDVTKNGEDFIVTILTVFDKLIKVVI